MLRQIAVLGLAVTSVEQILGVDVVTIEAKFPNKLNYVKENAKQLSLELFSPEDLDTLKNCPATDLHVDTDFEFEVGRNGSSHKSSFVYYDLKEKKMKTVWLMGGYADWTTFEYNAKKLTVQCMGDSDSKQRQCSGVSYPVPASGILLKFKMDPRNGNAHKNEWHRNSYTIKGSFLRITCANLNALIDENYFLANSWLEASFALDAKKKELADCKSTAEDYVKRYNDCIGEYNDCVAGVSLVVQQYGQVDGAWTHADRALHQKNNLEVVKKCKSSWSTLDTIFES